MGFLLESPVQLADSQVLHLSTPWGALQSRLRPATLVQPTVPMQPLHPCENGGRSLPIICGGCPTSSSNPSSMRHVQPVDAAPCAPTSWRRYPMRRSKY